jgi:hypothetical protein
MIKYSSRIIASFECAQSVVIIIEDLSLPLFPLTLFDASVPCVCTFTTYLTESLFSLMSPLDMSRIVMVLPCSLDENKI